MAASASDHSELYVHVTFKKFTKKQVALK